MGTELTADQVDRLLDLQRLHTGGTRLATRLALKTGHIAVNLAGGLHHAQREKGGGFCIFNDVAVAIEAERERGFDGEVLIIDLDLHDGDGTRAIFTDDPLVFTFSIHARHWGPPEALASFSLELGSKVSDEVYLSALRQELPQIFATLQPKLVFFLAGTDPSREDPIGNWQISPAGMLARDLLVLDLARGGERKIPTVVTLAGGYGTEAWRYTARFLSAMMRLGKALEPPSTEEITLKRYRYIHSLFGSDELSGASGENDFGLTEEDLYLPGWGATRETRFLGFYTKHGLELVFERSGFLNRLRDLGWSHPTLEMNLGDPAGHTLRLYDNPAKEEILAELRVQRDRRSIDGMELLSIEWLLLQNPRASFGPGRLPLPGQSHPGLGMVGDMVALLTVACERLHLDGLILVPAQLHVARLGHGYMRFLEPTAQARYEAIQAAVAHLPFAVATQAVAAGRLRDSESGEPIRWQPSPMILPISQALQRLIEEKEKQARRDPPGAFSFELEENQPR
jgi:hypothetical protein